MARQERNEGLYQATVQAFIKAGMPEYLAQPAAEVVATDSVNGTPDNPTERTPEQQQAVTAAWNWWAENVQKGAAHGRQQTSA